MAFVLMILAAVGMIFGAVKMKQGVDWGKGLTVGCAVVALLLAGVHMKSRMGRSRLSKNEIKRLQEREESYQKIAGEKLAKYLAANTSATKAVVIRPAYIGYEAPHIASQIEGLKTGFADRVEILEVMQPEIPPEVQQEIEQIKQQYSQDVGENEELPEDLMMGLGGMMDSMDAEQFNQLTRRIPREAEIVILLIDFPYDLENMTLLGMKKQVAGIINMPQPKMKAAIKGGYINAVVLTNPEGDFKSRDVPKDLDEAFARRYLLVTAETVDDIVGKYPNMFPDM